MSHIYLASIQYLSRNCLAFVQQRMCQLLDNPQYVSRLIQSVNEGTLFSIMIKMIAGWKTFTRSCLNHLKSPLIMRQMSPIDGQSVVHWLPNWLQLIYRYLGVVITKQEKQDTPVASLGLWLQCPIQITLNTPVIFAQICSFVRAEISDFRPYQVWWIVTVPKERRGMIYHSDGSGGK